MFPACFYYDHYTCINASNPVYADFLFALWLEREKRKHQITFNFNPLQWGCPLRVYTLLSRMHYSFFFSLSLMVTRYCYLFWWVHPFQADDTQYFYLSRVATVEVHKYYIYTLTPSVVAGNIGVMSSVRERTRYGTAQLSSCNMILL